MTLLEITDVGEPSTGRAAPAGSSRRGPGLNFNPSPKPQLLFPASRASLLACLSTLLFLSAGTGHAETPPGPFEEGLPIRFSTLEEIPSQHLTLSPRQIVVSGPKQILPFVHSSESGFTAYRFTNMTDSDAEFSFTIRDTNGSLLALPVARDSGGTQQGSGSDSILLRPYQALSLTFAPESPSKIGWIDFTSEPDASVAVNGYWFTQGGITNIEPTERFRRAWLPVDRLSDLTNTLVVINPSPSREQTLTLAFRSAGVACQGTIGIRPMGQTRLDIESNFPCYVNSSGGVLEIQSQDEFSGVLLSAYSGIGTFSTRFIERSVAMGPSFGSATISNRTYDAGTAISALILPAASGGDGSLTYSLSPNVPGLRFNSATRSVAGTPTTAGTYRMTYTVGDSGGDSDSISFVLTVRSRPTPPTPPPSTDEFTPLETWMVSSGTVRFSIFHSRQCLSISALTLSGTTYSFHTSKWQTRAGANSAWTDVPGTAHTGGVCAYSPTESGQYRGVAEISLNGERGMYKTGNVLTVEGGGPSPGDRPSFGSASIGNRTYTAGNAISTLTLPAASGGDGSLTYSLSPNVPGLTFNAASRRLFGRPSGSGAYTMTYTARDSDGDTATLRFTITVQSADRRPSFGSASVGNRTYTAGNAISTLTLPAASGGDGRLTYSLSPNVPGLTFSASTRRLTGTPTSAGSYNMTYTATDADGDAARLSFVVVVNRASTTTGTTGEYMPAPFWTVRPGGITLGQFSAGGCIVLGTDVIASSKWQRRDSPASPWVDVPGTEQTGRACPYSPTEPGQYRQVGVINVDGEIGRWASSNFLTVDP